MFIWRRCGGYLGGGQDGNGMNKETIELLLSGKERGRKEGRTERGALRFTGQNKLPMGLMGLFGKQQHGREMASYGIRFNIIVDSW